MTNYEILKECKTAWEILNDLVDNCEYIKDKDRKELTKSMEILDNTYTDTWEKIYKSEDKKQLETDILDRYEHKMIISDLIGYAYLCEECDENMYLCEGDTNYVWWLED